MLIFDLPLTDSDMFGSAIVPSVEHRSLFLFLAKSSVERIDGITLPVNKVENPLLSRENGRSPLQL